MGYWNELPVVEIIPENTVGFEGCKLCNGLGYVFDKERFGKGKDYSKSKGGRTIDVKNKYYKQCPICDSKNKFAPLLDCPLCEGEHTNDHECPYCDMIYDNWNTREYYGKTYMSYDNIKELLLFDKTKKNVLIWMGKKIMEKCKSHKKDDPQEFQYHPLAYAYRRVLREVWSI